jgi:hypothetical protein
MYVESNEARLQWTQLKLNRPFLIKKCGNFNILPVNQTIFSRSIKVDCITVSTTPVKTTIDDLIQQLFDALLNSLRRNIVNHIQTIDNFVTEGMESLSTRPQTVEEIGLANEKHEELSKKIPEVSLSIITVFN